MRTETTLLAFACAVLRCARASSGGYVLLRRGSRVRPQTGVRQPYWKINVRLQGREWTSTGQTLEGAMQRAAQRCSEQREAGSREHGA